MTFERVTIPFFSSILNKCEQCLENSPLSHILSSNSEKIVEIELAIAKSRSYKSSSSSRATFICVPKRLGVRSQRC